MYQLAQLKEYLSSKLPHMSPDRCHLMLVNGQIVNGNMNYTVRILLLDYKFDPLQVLSHIRAWLLQHNLLRDNAGNEIAFSFSSEIIDLETFDLEIDFPLNQKVVLEGDDFHICGQMVWNEAQQQFVRA